MSEKQKRSVLSLKVNQFIIKTKTNPPFSAQLFIAQKSHEKSRKKHDFRNGDESSEDEVSEICTIPAEKKVKQSKITDFFRTGK